MFGTHQGSGARATHVRTHIHVSRIAYKDARAPESTGRDTEFGCAKPTGSQPAEVVSAADENRFEGLLFQAPFLQRSSSSTAVSVIMRPPDFTSLLWNVLRCVS